MALSIGIVGLPNVGKSTLFNALTDAQALAANYPFATIEPNTGIVPIPDPRLGKLAELYKTDKVVPATVTFVDIAGLVEGASKGEGLGNQFLSHIRSCNAICQVVRAFEDPDVTRSGSTDPNHDIDIINTELVLADISTLDTRRSKLDKEVKANPKLSQELDVFDEVRSLFDKNQRPDWASIFQRPSSIVQSLQLLTAKPVIYVFNLNETTLADQAKKDQLKQSVKGDSIFICAKLESELRGLDESDRAELLESYGQSESGLLQLIHAAYDTLGLQSYLTAGEKEVRAWTIPKGCTAPQAAGVIHGDFERGFIAAQVVDYKDLITAGSIASARSAGKVRTEGKDYIMQPNDVVEFRFNV